MGEDYRRVGDPPVISALVSSQHQAGLVSAIRAVTARRFQGRIMLMRNMIAAVLLFVSGLQVPLACASPNRFPHQADAIILEAQRLAATDDFASIERLVKHYNARQQMNENGLSSVGTFYTAMSGSFEIDVADTEAWNRRFAWADRWIAAYPKSPTARVMRGRIEFLRGASYRGSGWARDVTPENNASYQRYASQAADYLLEHRAIASKDPYFYRTLLIIGFRMDWPEFELMALFDEGAERYPYYFGQFTVPMMYYTPRWGGSFEAMEAFARHAMARVPPPDRAALYARLYTYAQFLGWESPLTGGQIDWPLFDEGTRNIVARYPSPGNLQAYASMGCGSQHRARAAAFLQQFRGEPDLKIWGDAQKFEFCSAYAKGAFPFLDNRPRISPPWNPPK